MQPVKNKYSHHKHVDTISFELRKLLESISQTKKTEKNTFLFQEGMDAEEIYILKSGRIQIEKLTADGKELTLRICKTNDLIGELTLFSDDPKYLLSARVLTEGEILVIKRDLLEKELIKDGELTFEFMRWVSNHMRIFQSKIRDLLLNGKKGALYSTLIRLTNSYGIETNDGILIEMALTNQQLANFCAATRESVNRMLSELRKSDIINISKNGHIVVKDVEFLRQEIGCENCPVEICNIN
ncbi:transcriptional regulator [Gracilibacillus ureilyticus]|uniref:Transcriptional regulator n=1 Tax=Gracilibacillus ureilyticus TaxID=531814 RepID=A0A1H9S151_9BACI|nr:Crp/Fnr family transcriptional regulator [Gracilibacillus ureilyticus]SER78365.1 transcriptional regulator [Gracilibacillus ureilyticus]